MAKVAEGAPLGNKRAAKAPGEKRVHVNVRLSPQSHEWLMRFESTKTETLDGILEILRAQSITDLYTLRTLLDEADAQRRNNLDERKQIRSTIDE